MSSVNARTLHNNTSAVLDEVERGVSFLVERSGRTIARLQPVTAGKDPGWEEIMSEVWRAQKQIRVKSQNPVLAERARRRR
jgi:antitoxin (DNA-binding transcriptional repressor) of toxin-antitoxin stability system